ncbi:MAG: class I SAM-dependent methyltransferase [Candidatus Geothermincolia bacterium]
MQEGFWDGTWDDFEVFHLDPELFHDQSPKSERALLDSIGDVRGKSVLDLGCGNGTLSVYLALRGASVTAVDTSERAASNTAALAAGNCVSVTSIKAGAGDIGELGPFDMIVGRFILHHLEPFAEAADVLWAALKEGGRAAFLENSANNPVLMFFRRHVVGRFGVPKYGDREEQPLDVGEVHMLVTRFREVNVSQPEFLFFRLLGSYIFRDREPWMGIFRRMDSLAYSLAPRLRRYSYLQLIELRR